MANYDSFTGFTFNGKHSSDFHIIRVSNGSRYENELVPAPKDTTIDVPFGDGMYLFRSKYQQRTFNIEFAYDSVEEKDIRAITQWLSEKKPCDLIFDETPYKKYKAKINNAPKMSWICFDATRVVNGVEESYRVYKGEGNIQFVCYYPWAESIYKALGNYDPSLPQYANKWEWADASGMLTSLSTYDTWQSSLTSSSKGFKLYNAGDIPTDFKLKLVLPSSTTNDITITLRDSLTTGSTILGQLMLSHPKALDSTSAISYIQIDTKQHLIFAVDPTTGIVSNQVINYLIKQGDFFQISKSDSAQYLVISGANDDDDNEIEYSYKYY